MTRFAADIERKALWAVVAVAIALRVIAVLTYGPLHQPDSSSFTQAAEVMLRGGDWPSVARIDDFSSHEMTLRMLGYPAIIAGAKLLTGDWAEHLVVLLQATLSVLATALVFRVARSLSLGVMVSAFAALAHTSSIALLFDFNILTDSLFANGLLIAATLITIGICEARPPRYRELLCLAGLLVLSFVVRETTVYFVPFWAVGIAIWAWRSGLLWPRSIVCVLVFILPVVLAATSYREWNRYRTGAAFLTTGAQFTMWFAPIEVARAKGLAIFSADRQIEAALAEALKTDPDYPMLGAGAINIHLFQNGLTSVEIGSLAFKAYVTALLHAPVTLIRDRLTRFRARAVLLLVNASLPQEVMRDLSEKRENAPFIGKARDAIAQGGAAGFAALALVGLEILQLAVSAILLVAFVLGVPAIVLAQVWRQRRLDLAPMILGWFWMMYWALNGAYILASFEGRYAMATLPLACIGGLWICRQAFLAARKASYSRI